MRGSSRFIYILKHDTKDSCLSDEGFDDLVLRPGPSQQRLRTINRHVNIKWQTAWSHYTGAGITHGFLLSVHRRSRMPWLYPVHRVTQFLSGHGDFNQKLYSFGLVGHPLCACGEEESPKHILLSCGLYEDLRDVLRRHLMTFGIRWPPPLPALIARSTFPAFVRYIDGIMTRKEQHRAWGDPWRLR